MALISKEYDQFVESDVHSLQKQDLAFTSRHYEHFIKYMGSKSKIMDFLLEGINSVYSGDRVCDLFAGSASLAGAIGDQIPIHSNDIQNYSAVLANTYLNAWDDGNIPSLEILKELSTQIFERNYKSLNIRNSYQNISDVQAFIELEKSEQKLIDRRFNRDWHLFVKYYSGTWWNIEQCLWIDAIREVAETHKNTPAYSVILSCLMYAMAYTSQGTGHFAQYRDAISESSMKDILIYRKRSVWDYFAKKYISATSQLSSVKPKYKHTVTALDFSECLDVFGSGTVYADPPYCFVHYSRFYHALETIALYDYPEIQIKKGKIVKGRYRENRHQSPFCIKTQVPSAFHTMFEKIKANGQSLVLSYSNTGMISIEEIGQLAEDILGSNYSLELLTTSHEHMTLGRVKDRHRDVKECLLLAKLG